MHIEIAVRNHCVLVRKAKVKKMLTIPKAGENVEQLELSYTTGGSEAW